MDIDQILTLDGSWDKLKNTDKPVCIYGTGNACEKILEEFRHRGITCSAIFASEGFVRDREFAGFHVMSYSEVIDEFGDPLICCAFGSELPDVMNYIKGLSQKHELVFPDLPVAGSELFSVQGLFERYDRVKELYGMLSDDLSKKVLNGVLSFKVTGDISFLTPVFSDPANDLLSIIKPNKSDSYADLGAYNGDTAQRFIQLAGGYEHIYVFEPDKKSFRKCLERMKKLDNITFINSAAWNSDGNIGFSQTASRQSMISESGEMISARSLDSVLNGKGCSVIKYDVEGAEYEAILGSEQTIRSFVPRLAVSVYHRPYDIIDLPVLISQLDMGYRLYLRQAPYFPAWDTMLYAVK